MNVQATNPKWRRRMESYFDSVCLCDHKHLSIEEIQQWATNLETTCHPTPNEMVRMRAQLYTFWGQVGLLPGRKLTKDEFVEGIKQLGCEERERRRNGVMTYHQMISNAFFDVIDTNKDGVLTVDELRNALKASNQNPCDAEKWLSVADTNKNGVLERGELFESEFNFWFNPD